MAKSLVGALALALLPSALAFRNTSPYFLFSTADLDIPTHPEGLARADVVIEQLSSSLQACPTKTYFVVRQHGVSAADFSHASRAAPRLASHLNGEGDHVKSTLVVPHVVEDESTVAAISQYLHTTCGAEVLPEHHTETSSDKQRVIQISFAAPPAERNLRTAQLDHWDRELQSLISKHAQFEDFTVIYTSTPQTNFQSEHPPYEMESPFDGAMQMELKRDLSVHGRSDPSVHTKRALQNQPGLFEKYQYFTPGLFMGFIAAVPLSLIVIVGVKALVSLEVSYFAFSKEMGPAAQRQK